MAKGLLSRPATDGAKEATWVEGEWPTPGEVLEVMRHWRQAHREDLE